MPSVQRNDIDNTSALIRVTLTKAELKPKIDAELKRLRTRMPVKGFRQGHTPIEYLKRMYGKAVFGEVLNDMLSEELYNYLRESKLDVLGQPLPTDNQTSYSFKIDQLEDEYSVEYEVGFVPPFEIQGLSKDQTFERLTVSNLDELAEKDLEYARKRMGKRSNPENDIQEKDLLTVAVHELDGDALKEGGWATSMTVFVESIPDEGLRHEFLSRKKGDTLRFNARLMEMGDDEEKFRKYILNLPEDDNRTVGDWYEGTIEEVSRVDIADLDEEFFNSYFGSGVSSETEALGELKKGILNFYDGRSDALLMRDFQTRLLELNRFELPDTFLRRWLKVNNPELSDEQIDNEYTPFAENLRWSLLRERLKDRFAIEVTEAEIRERFALRIQSYLQAQLPEHVIEGAIDRMMQEKKNVDDTRKDLEWDKLFGFIRDEVTIVDKPIPSDEFHEIVDAITKQAQQEQEADATLRETVEE